jgi:hypothetical protein
MNSPQSASGGLGIKEEDVNSYPPLTLTLSPIGGEGIRGNPAANYREL